MSTLDDDLVNNVPYPQRGPSRRSFSWLFMVALALLFRIMHFPGTSVLIIFSVSGLFASSLDYVIAYKGKNKLSLSLLIISSIFIVTFITGAVFDSGGSFAVNGIGLLVVTATGFFIGYRIYRDFVKRKNRNL